jgi:hypothetical protein
LSQAALDISRKSGFIATQDEAVIVLAEPVPRSRLRLRGRHFVSGSMARLSIRINGQGCGTYRLEAADFAIDVPVPEPSAGSTTQSDVPQLLRQHAYIEILYASGEGSIEGDSGGREHYGISSAALIPIDAQSHQPDIAGSFAAYSTS